MSIKISALPPAASVLTTDIIPCVVLSGPTTSKVAIADVLLAGGIGSGFITVGLASAASTGALRFVNAAAVKFRDFADAADLTALAGSAADTLYIGSESDLVTNRFTNVFCLPASNFYVGGGGNAAVGFSVVGATMQNNLAFSFPGTSHIDLAGTVAHSSQIRAANNVVIIAARDAADSADLPLLSVDNSNYVYLGNTAGSYIATLAGGTDVIFSTAGAGIIARWGASHLDFEVPLRRTVPAALTQVLEINDVGVNYPVIQANGGTGEQIFSDDAFITTLKGYSSLIRGASGGVSFFDGRNSITTDSAVVSKRLNTTFNSLTGTNAPQNTNLSFAVNATEIWEIEINGTVRPSASTGARFAIMAPSGTIVDGWVQCTLATSSSTIGLVQLLQPNVLTILNLATLANTQAPFRIFSTVKIGANAGNITLGVSGGGATGAVSLMSGSHLKARRADSV